MSGKCINDGNWGLTKKSTLSAAKLCGISERWRSSGEDVGERRQGALSTRWWQRFWRTAGLLSFTPQPGLVEIVRPDWMLSCTNREFMGEICKIVFWNWTNQVDKKVHEKHWQIMLNLIKNLFSMRNRKRTGVKYGWQELSVFANQEPFGQLTGWMVGVPMWRISGFDTQDLRYDEDFSQSGENQLF